MGRVPRINVACNTCEVAIFDLALYRTRITSNIQENFQRRVCCFLVEVTRLSSLLDIYTLVVIFYQ